MNDSKPRQCFYIPEEQYDDEGWIPSLVTEGQPGHAPFTGNGPFASPWHWGTTLAEAQATAERENRGTFGLSADEALSIVLSSIAAGGEPDTADDPAARAARDALMPYACGECGTEVLAAGDEPDHFPWCPRTARPFTARVRDAEIRVYDREDGTDDASDMYVMEVLGVTVRVRLVTREGLLTGDPDRTEPFITVEAGGRFAVSVNEDANTYGDGS